MEVHDRKGEKEESRRGNGIANNKVRIMSE